MKTTLRMLPRRTAILLAGWVFGIAATSTYAGHDDGYYVDADVVHVEPIIQQHTVNRPREVCDVYVDRDYRNRRWDEPYYHEVDPGPVPKIIGGLIGGLIGHQFGGGRGKTALTIAGALVGGSIANNTARKRHRHRYTEVRRDTECWTVNDRSTVNRLDGYRVTYLYQGRKFVKHMDEHPGDHVRVHVRVSPAF
ncbi:MAG: glycine zipper 2TM domain-containing protein [Gammaproteobacteria bacterium]|nr:glycine zipper 2TM domain-containing protein [Gammaproteobacteria bacterium]